MAAAREEGGRGPRIDVVAGARPQFVKAAALLPALREVFGPAGVRLLHTGQHVDPRMVEAHFAGLGLPPPEVRMATSGPNRAMRCAAMVAALAEAWDAAPPTWALSLGDTDTALATALTASLLEVPLAHVEAGARSGESNLPEEHNRLVIDDLSGLLFCATPGHAANLEDHDGVHVTGDVMADLLLAKEAEVRTRTPRRDPYAVLTLHRAATADDPAALDRVMLGARRAELPVVFPRHPRTRPREMPPNVEEREPLPYLDFLGLVAGARFVLTDSGGLQKEAYLLGVPCITLREATEWGETVEAGWNVLAGTDPDAIAAAAADPPQAASRPPLFGDGRAAARIAALLRC